MSKLFKAALIGGLLTASAGIAPASAQLRTKPVLGPTNPVKPAQLSEPQTSFRPAPRPKVVAPKNIKAFYNCDVETVTEKMGQKVTRQEQFTLSALDDGSLVYGGKDPRSTDFRYKLVDDGEWRLIESAGWIQGREPSEGGAMSKGPNARPTSGWITSPRIHRSTGEYVSVSWGEAFGIRSQYTSTGRCSGGV